MFLCVIITFEQIPISKSPSTFELFWIHVLLMDVKNMFPSKIKTGLAILPIQQSLNHTLLILLSVFEH